MKRLAESRRKRADQPPSGEAHCERNGAQCKLPLRGGCLLSSIRGHDDSDLPLREQLSAESERVGRELQHTSPAPSPPTETVGTTPAESSPLLNISHPKLCSFLTAVAGGRQLRQPDHHGLVHRVTRLHHKRAQDVNCENGKSRQLDQRGRGQKMPCPRCITLIRQHLTGNTKRASKRQQKQPHKHQPWTPQQAHPGKRRQNSLSDAKDHRAHEAHRERVPRSSPESTGRIPLARCHAKTCGDQQPCV